MGTIITIIPPLAALALAQITKNIMLALFVGILGCAIIAGGFGFLPLVLEDYIFNGIVSNVDMYIYLVLFGAFMAAIKRGGGFAAFSSFAD